LKEFLSANLIALL